MIAFADEDLNPRGARNGYLGMAFEAEIVISLDQHLGMRSPVWIMTTDAAFPHRLMLKDMHTSLLSVTAHAGFVHSRHG